MPAYARTSTAANISIDTIVFICININMRSREKIAAKNRFELAAIAAGLNGDRWHGPLLELPDGNFFPQSDPEECQIVKQWAGDLIRLGWDLRRWRDEHEKDWAHFEQGLALYRPEPYLDGAKQLKFQYLPIDTAGTPILPSRWWVFALLAGNPERERFGRCYRCQRFYVSEGRYTRKRYCSRRCAHNTAASHYGGRHYATLRKQRLAMALRLLPRWRPSFGDWKGWMVREAKGLLTRNFLTRCELLRQRTPPKKEKATK